MPDVLRSSDHLLRYFHKGRVPDPLEKGADEGRSGAARLLLAVQSGTQGGGEMERTSSSYSQASGEENGDGIAFDPGQQLQGERRRFDAVGGRDGEPNGRGSQKIRRGSPPTGNTLWVSYYRKWGGGRSGVRPLPHRSKGSINIGDGASPPSAEGNDWGVNVNPDSRYTYENMTYRPSLIAQRERYRHLQMGERSSPRIDKEVGAVILPTDEEKEEVEEKVEVEGTEFADRNPSTSRAVVAVVLEENSSIVPRMDGIGGQRVTTRRLYSDGRRTVMIRDVEDGAEAEAGGELIMEEMELHPTIVQGGSDVKKGVMEKDGVYVEAVGVDNEVWDEDELGLQVALRLSLQDAEW